MPTKTEKDISQQQFLQGKLQLIKLLDTVDIEAVCFVGIKCANHFLTTPSLKTSPNHYGFMKNYNNSNNKIIPVFSVPSTSGRVKISKTEQQGHWQQLVEQMVQRDIKVSKIEK